MVTANEAEVTLKTIRSLMERATIYRAVSARTAILGGILSIALGLWGMIVPIHDQIFGFILPWIIVCLFVCTCNAIVLHKQAWLRSEPFVSPGMRLALRGIIPPLIAGLVFTVLLPPLPILVTLWMIFYGLALLSTQEFAPDSIRWLGHAFVTMGILTGLLHSLFPGQIPGPVFGSVAMALSFGVFHLVYGIVTRQTSKQELAVKKDAEPAA